MNSDTDQPANLNFAAATSALQARAPTNFVNPYSEFPTLKNPRVRFTSADPFVPTYVQSNFTNVADPRSAYASRIKGRQILLERSVREGKAKVDQEEKRKSKRERKEKKAGASGVEKGMWKLAEEQTRFDLFLPLHHLWCGYMSELLGLSPPPSTPPSPQTPIPNSSAMHAKLVKADFHGSILTVRQNKNPCIVGLSGIVILESENAFRVVTKDDKVKLIPKQNSIFTFSVPLHSTITDPKTIPSPNDPTRTDVNPKSFLGPTSTVLDIPHLEFELYGNQFCFRAAERAGRKFKHKETIEL
ncbi:hypothetical protein JAAARDRAFT_175593 [Jaapia argillacea MUCL 33604]|uniref:Uncharacterized protein n=1 Tax=Jaapia argillacea MUCL 33604 TaxID=933084 RepID=A0A067Q8Q5_9AGAM|nr:hypothetical protein JAAARDRAFT_175593 [Jaapia argillacea MUCL 33604]